MKNLKYIIGHWKSQFTNKDDKKPLGQLLSEAVEYYNLKIPCKIDRDTYMDSCEFKNNKLIFNCRLCTIEKEEFEYDLNDFNEHLAESLKNQADRTKRLKRILNKSGTIEYNYQDLNKEHFTTISL